MTVRNPLPKNLRAPAGGLSNAEEPDEVKGLRLLAALRHLAHGKYGTLGLTIDDVPIVLVKWNGEVHPAEADFTGTEA